MPSDRANSQGRLILQITAVVLLTALLAGILVFERRRNAAGLSLVEADVTTVEEREETVGYVFRTETVLKSEKDGALRYTVADGAKVTAGDALLHAYAGKGDGGDRAIGRVLSEELAFWRTLAAADGAWQTDYFDAYRRLMALYGANGTANGAGDRLQAATDLLEALNRREADRDAILLRIEALEREFDALVRDAGAPETVVSPVTGRFFDSVDGYETLLDPSLLTDLTPAGMEALLETPAIDPTAVGRVVTGISVLAVPVSAEVAATLTVGQACDMLLGDKWRAEMVLKSISAADEEGRVLLTFLAPEEVDCERKWQVSFLTGTHTGIRVPMGAVRNEDDGLFVYVAEGGCAVRRRIEPILYRDGYCLSAVDAGEGALAVGEKIVLTSRRIYEGKKLK